MTTTKEKIYAILMLIVGFVLLGTSGAMENDVISFEQGLIQISACVVSGLFLSYLIWLEETRTARRLRR